MQIKHFKPMFVNGGWWYLATSALRLEASPKD